MRGLGLLIGLGIVALGCGPQVDLETADDTSSGGDATAGSVGPVTSTSTSTTTTPPPPPGDTTLMPPAETSVGVDPDVGFPEYCSTIEQDCPPGYKCMPWADDGGSSWNATKCVEVAADPSAPGEPCSVEGNGLSGIDTCDATSMCWDVDPRTNEGVCAPFCIGTEESPSCEDPCSQCSLSGDGALTICLPGCDPLAQDCPPGQACYPYIESYVCAPDASGDMGALGSPCEFINVCDAGLACVPASAVPDCAGIGCCSPFCDAGGMDPCPAALPGTVCTPFFTGGDGPPMRCTSGEVGICALP